MKDLKYTVSGPVPRYYQWDYVDETSEMKLLSDVDLDAVGTVHVHLAQLATKMGRVSDKL